MLRFNASFTVGLLDEIGHAILSLEQGNDIALFLKYLRQTYIHIKIMYNKTIIIRGISKVWDFRNRSKKSQQMKWVFKIIITKPQKGCGSKHF